MKLYKFGITEVVVYINESLNKKHLKNLTENLNTLNGISKVLMSDQKPHLIRISYDPQTINSQQVLQGINNHGIHAQLAG